MDCVCHPESPTRFPDDVVPAREVTEAEWFTAVQCGCGSRQWRVWWDVSLAPTERALHCAACGRVELVACPGWAVEEAVQRLAEGPQR